MTTLNDLAPVTVTVELERPDGQTVGVPLRLLTYSEWQRIGWEVPEPAPPVSGATREGPVFNTSDPDYLRQRAEAQTERQYRRLLAALEIDIPGDTPAEQVAALRQTLDYGMARQLFAALGKLAGEGEGRVAARADSFRGG